MSEDLLAEVGHQYHDCAIVADSRHPAVAWEHCTDPLCVKVRAYLSRPTIDLAAIRDFARQFAEAGMENRT